jgi:hypothetical protein
VSEPIEPLPGRFDAVAMVRGEPGLPEGFTWRGETRRIEEVLGAGKTATPDMGELYVRRHTWKLRMDDGATWNVYFLRQPPKTRSRRAKARRWFLLSLE